MILNLRKHTKKLNFEKQSDGNINQPTGSFPLESRGSEILIPALTFSLGLYRISVDLKLLDDSQPLQSMDSIYMAVTNSPLIASIRCL